MRTGAGAPWRWRWLVGLWVLQASACALVDVHGIEARQVQALHEVAHEAVIEVLVDGQLIGAGFVVDPDGLALTALHVVGQPGARVEALHGGELVAVQVLAVDRGHDLALIDLGSREGGWPTLTFAEASPAVGARVYVIGAPHYRHGLLMEGRLASGSLAFEWLDDQQAFIEVRHVAAQTPWGLSGGPWLAPDGTVVGLQSGMMVNGRAMVGIAYAAPLAPMRRLLQTQASAATATLGAAVEEVWSQDPTFLSQLPRHTRGLVVRAVLKGGPLARAAIAPGDIIVAVDGAPVSYVHELLSRVRAQAPGATVALTVIQTPMTRQRVQVKTVTLARLETGWLPPAEGASSP